MVNTEMMPTEEMLMSCLLDDAIGRNKELALFYRLLESPTCGRIIGLDGRWGCGKTFFVKQMRILIDALNPNSNMDVNRRGNIVFHVDRNLADQENNDITVYYDAWENDNDTEPVISIVYEITKQLEIDCSLEDRDIFDLAASIIEIIWNRNVKGIIDALKSDDPLSMLKKQKELEQKIRDFLSNVLNERGNRLIIFIDELDRCKPSYAVQLLEQIKHYLCDDRITFVLSINSQELQHTIKHFYGPEYDACRYLDRFFDFRIALPPADEYKVSNLYNVNTTNTYDIVCKRVADMLHFELREMHRYFTQAKVAASKVMYNDPGGYHFSFSQGKGRQFVLMYIVPLLIGLQMADITEYTQFVDGNESKFLYKLLEDEQVSYDIFEHMLSRSETLNRDEDGKITVTKRDVIEKIYNALFSVNSEAETILGEYQFSKSMKSTAIAAASMLSNYADY